ncbi:LLM class flavin-dependent oxidoreductase [Conexibacter sp. JD483]|uniref:LLM class flavin-dependent oxidoreductase n=1 Tax=unclassified Conexibacter TaxID=2627773 RepID=UPI0027200044|nr:MULTISPECIES: LLM class flavin-dependent oxidoreductase [unclassified Conexibacter]MDO8187937.1 LLM class flavin-dependent oxidoreductase [Conexibacter sp. CPCC 205706]MDO8200194.1 LLM class flavin-dependent oxidoreductase [Conexibacter sp. CPCC 205762]MDR9369740.1 LLM class flavin-dependent oxidoreductase [Conexibacter sp. JD483]
MKVGLSLYIQNYADWDRFNALERGEQVPPLEPNTDAQIWAEELETVAMIEELGFDSLWTVEHHVSPYTMVTNPIQALTYVAGATRRIDVGTMVVILPWHDPLRVAEEMTMLQFVLRDRTPLIGVGRGLGRREFKALNVDQNESRGMFKESVEVIKLALSEEKFSYEGEHFRYENTTMRPRPRDPQALIDSLCFSWGSPSSAPVGAGLGLRPLIIPQKALADYHDELVAFASARSEAGYEPARPRLHLHMYCHEDAAKAEAAANRYVPQYVDSASRNYELSGSHFERLKGYEHYKDTASVPRSAMDEAWIANSIWGTPDQCIEKLRRLCDAFHPEEFMLTGRYGDMPHAESVASLELFAREVLPAIQEIPLEEPVAFAAGTSA